MSETNKPATSPAEIAKQSYEGMSSENTTGTNGYYSKFNTNNTQSFMGAVGQSLVAGASRALPEGFKTDVQVLSDFRLGTFLRRKGVITGDAASIVDGVIDFMRPDKTTTSNLSVPRFNHTTKFIPIVLKSEFKLAQSTSANRDNFYIIFDSTPEKISFSKSASWNPKEFYGRPEPIQIFASSSAITFSLTGMFFSDSESDHVDKLKLENRLFALVTPSKNHFMPSPVEVRIGEWKRLRCIVNSVSIDYQGPWRTTSTPQNNAEFRRLTQADSTATGRSLPSHSPYLYEATFSFTVVSELNTVQFAEDIVDVGCNGGYSTSTPTSINFSEVTEPTKSTKYKNSTMSIGDNNTSIIYEVSGYAGQSGTVIDTASGFANTAQYLKSLGLPSDANNSTKLAALAQITSGLTATVQGVITKTYGTQITKLFGK